MERDWSGEKLMLKGQGSAYYAGLFHIYDAALYLPAQTTPSQALDARTPRCLELHYHIDLSRQQFIAASSTVLQRQQNNLSPLETRIERLHAAYQDVKPGDRYSLCYAPQAGTELLLNTQPLLNIEGGDFATAYFSIWLGDAAISESLRKTLLGGQSL